MELYTTNLLSISVQQSRLQSNFEAINTAFKDLQQQVTILTNQHEGIIQSILQNKHQIQSVGNKTQKHNTLLHQHKNWIDQLNSQFGGFDSQINSTDQESNQDIPAHQRRESKRRAKEDAKNKKNQDRRNTEEGDRQQGKGNEKVGFQEMIASFRDRIRALQNDSQEKKEQIEELKKFLTLRRNRDSQNHQKRGSMLSKEYISKNSASKKDIKQSNMMIELRQNDNQEKSEKGGSQKQVHTPSVNRSDDEFLFTDKDLDFNMEDKLVSLFRDFQKMKEAFGQRNRILDAHMKDNQQKIQNVQKNMDMLERSHDMLKYDFDRTNTSFSKTRPANQTNEQKARRIQEKLNDTRITNKEYYEQKLIELFNEMDFLKGEYFELQTKLQKQVEDEPQDDKNERKLKFAHKILNSQKESDQSMRRQVIMHRHELKKIREQFEEFTLGVNNGSNQIKTILIKPNENKQDWKSLSTKMQKLKTEVQSGIRELQGKIVTSNDMIVGLNQLEVGIQECKLIMKKKVQINDFEKTVKRLETRLNNFIMQIFEKQGQENQFDAALAKQPWFCLSCDSQLKNYTGKVQKPNGNSQKLVGRKVNPESHMVRRNDNGRLPSVIK